MLNQSSSLAEIPSWSDLKFSNRFNKVWMDKQRQVGDSLADEVISSLKSRFPIQDPGDILQEVKRLAEAEGGVYRAFLDHCYQVPDWADFQAMEKGMRLFATHGPLWAISILAGGVIGSAFHVNAEPVFTNTGRFVVEDGVSSRLVETGAILGLIPFQGEVQPGGRHHGVVMKVRLLHAAIRYWSLEKTGEDAYPVSQCGLPINQQDMGYAMLIFSYLNVRGMLRLGAQLTDEQVQSLHLLWRYIGHVVGVDPAWLCTTIEEQKEFYYAFVKHQAREGVASIAALNLLDGSIQGVPKFASRFAIGTLSALTLHLSSPDFLTALKLEGRSSSLGLRVALGFTNIWNQLLKVPGGEKFLYWVGMRGLAKRYGDFGGVADSHSYGVKVHQRAEVSAALEEQRVKLASR